MSEDLGKWIDYFEKKLKDFEARLSNFEKQKPIKEIQESKKEVINESQKVLLNPKEEKEEVPGFLRHQVSDR